jgi:hypothetical protein
MDHPHSRCPAMMNRAAFVRHARRASCFEQSGERAAPDRSQHFSVDPEIGREASSQREPKCRESKARRLEFERDSYANQWHGVHQERDRRTDEAEFRQGH